MQEAHGVPVLEHLDPLISYPRQSLCEGSQFVIVSREQRATSELWCVMQELDHRLGDLSSVRIQVQVVRDELARRRALFDQGVPSRFDRELQAGIDLGASPAVLGRSERQAEQGVDPSDRLRAGSQ